MSIEELRKLIADNYDNYFGIDELPEQFEEIEEGDWQDNGKYSYSTSIVKDTINNKYYEIHNTRSGSYFTDYNYSPAQICEVMPKEETITVTKWIPV